MLDRSMIFDRTIRKYGYAPVGSLWYGHQLVGFRIGEYEDNGARFKDYTYYDIGIDAVLNLGFMGVPETYYGLEHAPRIEVIDHEGGLTTKEELDEGLKVTELSDPFVLAYLLKTYLFKGYYVYEGRNYISYGKRVVLLHKIVQFDAVGESQLVIDCTVYYGSAEMQEVASIVSQYTIYEKDVSDALYRGDGSISFKVSVYQLGEMIDTFGGVYTTSSIYHICMHFVGDDMSLKGKDMVCYSPKLKEVLWLKITDPHHLETWEQCLGDFANQLEGHEYVVL
jgi:hypothetical protein